MEQTCKNKFIAFIYSNELREQCDKLPTMQNRATYVTDLIYAYKLLPSDILKTVKPRFATEDEMKSFHSTSYIEFLKYNNEKDADDEPTDEHSEFGLMYDCPMMEKTFDFIRLISGATLAACEILIHEKALYAINWFGGWHHAQRDNAEGFCYINDIVIGINLLMQKFRKILYVDLDVHHGNGVQNAFEGSKRVMTFDMHKLSPGFYPGTGTADEKGIGDAKYYALNIPYKEGINSTNFVYLFTKIFPRVISSFKPDCIVVQCGADILAEDPIGECNVTINSMGICVKMIHTLQKPTVYLGGGGYNLTNTARYWTYLISILTNKPIPEDIPDESKFFTKYGPTYELQVLPTLMKDQNTRDYLDNIIESALEHCSKLE